MPIFISNLKSILKKIPQTYYYPILLSVPFLILILLGLNGSSIGTFNEAIDGNAGSNRIWGQNRWIRSDEYLATTPLLLSQFRNGNPQINEAIGTGIELGIQTNMPVKDFFSLFKIPTWLFLIINNDDIAFAFFWWIRVYILAVGSYLLLFEITNKNYIISILGSLSFIFTPFAHWWWNFELIGYASIIIFSLIKLVLSKKRKYIFFAAISFYFFSISFALLLYPPFQVPIVWGSIFIVLGILLNKLKQIKENPYNNFRSVLGGISVFAIFLTLFLFFSKYREIIEVITNTSYPGIRFFTGVGLSIANQFSGFYNILLQSDFNGEPVGLNNQSEASNFFLLYPAVIIFAATSTFTTIKNKFRKNDYLLISLSIWIITLVIWSYFPLPEVFAKATLLSQVPPSRIPIGLGFASYILTFYFLSTKLELSKYLKLLAGVISILSSVLILIQGNYILSNTPQYFAKPLFLIPEIKVALIASFFFVAIYLLLTRRIVLFSTVFLVFSFISTFAIHPIYRGLDSIDQTDFAKAVNSYPSSKDNKWIVYGDHRFAQYILANGGYVLNGIHYYPLFDMWDVIDERHEYFPVYNRYAHIHFNDKGEEYPLIELIYADQISVNMDPCDKRLEELKVKYFLMPQRVEKCCLIYRQSINTNLRGPLYIYERVND